MSATVTLPLWVFAILVAMSVTALAHYALLPGLRWIVRRRANQVIADVNRSLRVELPST